MEQNNEPFVPTPQGRNNKGKPLRPAGGKFVGAFETVEFAKRRAKSRARAKLAKAARRKNRG